MRIWRAPGPLRKRLRAGFIVLTPLAIALFGWLALDLRNCLMPAIFGRPVGPKWRGRVDANGYEPAKLRERQASAYIIIGP